MSAFEPRNWHTLDMDTKIRLFSLKFPPHQVMRTLRAGDGMSRAPFMPRLYTEEDIEPPPRPKLERHDSSYGAWRIPERASPKRVSFQDFPEPLEEMLRALQVLPQWEHERGAELA